MRSSSTLPASPFSSTRCVCLHTRKRPTHLLVAELHVSNVAEMAGIPAEAEGPIPSESVTVCPHRAPRRSGTRSGQTALAAKILQDLRPRSCHRNSSAGRTSMTERKTSSTSQL
jgi:hypothetical protein